MYPPLPVGGDKWDEFTVLADEFSALIELILNQYVTWCRRCSIAPMMTPDAALSGRPAVYIQKMAKQATHTKELQTLTLGHEQRDADDQRAATARSRRYL